MTQQTVNTNFEKWKDWSLIDPRPVLFFDDASQEWFSYWNGIFMLPEYALMLVSAKYWKTYPSMEMISEIDAKFRALYSMGKFDSIKNEAWDGVLTGDPFSYYKKAMYPHIKGTLANVRPSEVWEWFSKMYTGNNDGN